ncbi:MAG: cation:proton antiporter [Corynebacterium matruchotii]
MRAPTRSPSQRPRRTRILQAESLLNDGTALVVFAIALQAAQDSSGITAGLVARELLLSFGGGICAGVLVGAAVTKIGIRVRTITDDPMLATITALATPFVTFFLAANFPKITGDPESIHQVAFSYLRNTDGSLTPITDGRWFGTIGGKKLADFTPTSTTPVLAINVREADLKNITITHTTPEGIKTTLAVVDPQLSREAQTTLFVPTE